MRVALLSDIHGNLLALDAVLADLQSKGGADEYWVLGDLVAVGPKPVEVLERLHNLPKVRFTRGNTDRYVTHEDRPPPYQKDAKANPELISKVVQIAEAFTWTRALVSSNGWFDFLSELPLELRVTLPNGTRFLGVHASPNMDDGKGVQAIMEDASMAKLLQNCEADLLCVGHTHWALNRMVNSVHVVNLGSVSNPMTPNLNATYALLEATESGYTLEQYAVSYDREAFIQQLADVHMPKDTQSYLTEVVQGKYVKDWGKPII